MKNSEAKILSLDGIRGIAIAAVLLSHFLWPMDWYNTPWWKFLQGGWLGVDLFFTLSGFLITGILLRTRENPGYFSRFYKRRALRIFPLYYTVVIITALVIVFYEKNAQYRSGYDSLAWFFAFAPNIAMALKDNWLFHSHIFNLNHLWSLAVEEQFYLVWPFIVRWLPGKALIVLTAATVLASPGIRELTDQAFGHEWTIASYVLPYCRADGLLGGSFLAVSLHFRYSFRPNLALWIARFAFVGGGLWLVWMVVGDSTLYRGSIAAICFSAFIYLALNNHPRALVRRICEWSFLRHIGKYSYGLYVFHQMFEYTWHWAFGPEKLIPIVGAATGQVIYILLAFTGSYLLSRISWAILEEPILRLK